MATGLALHVQAKGSEAGRSNRRYGEGVQRGALVEHKAFNGVCTCDGEHGAVPESGGWRDSNQCLRLVGFDQRVGRPGV